MSRYEDDYIPGNPSDRWRDQHPRRRHGIEREDARAPYESQRQVRAFDDDRGDVAEHPWRAAHPQSAFGQGGREPRWDEQPARYGGGYADDELRTRGQRGDARYGLDTAAERAYGRRKQDDARGDYARASWTQEHDYNGPRYGADPRSGRDDVGGQYGRTDTYGGAGFRQQGKRYTFDDGDHRAQFRGTRPRGYERSDERLCELACECLTEADLDASDIEVRVEQGIVTLEGSVPTRWMKHQAEDLIDDLGGVKDIQNQLRVSNRANAGNNAASPTADTTPAPGTSANGGSTTASSATGVGGGNLGQGSGTGGRSRH
jgi:hypothetical protein